MRACGALHLAAIHGNGGIYQRRNFHANTKPLS
jgi:hypothetical protein